MSQHPIRPIPDISKQDIERFWSKVEMGRPDDCWKWKKGTSYGYGAMALSPDGKSRSLNYVASRVSLFIADGMQDTHRSMLALHSCDNKQCVNPKHLFWGTQSDNVSDRTRKGRSARGERHGSVTHPESILSGDRHPMAKLKEADVIVIRKRYKDGISTGVLMRQFDITRFHVWDIIKRRSWRHLP